MPMRPTPLGDRIKRSPQALLHRLDVDREFTSTALGAQIRKTEQVERVQLGPLPSRPPVGGTPELDQARLLRVARRSG